MEENRANGQDVHGAAMAALKTQAPQIGRAFGGLFQSLMKDGVLSARHKELIAVGIAVAVHCEPCVDAHVEKCLKAGASADEILEAAGVGVVMGGGPAYTHAALVAAAVRRLRTLTGHRRGRVARVMRARR